MASRYFIYSTLTADQLYTAWTTPPKGGMAAIKHQVRVKGGPMWPIIIRSRPAASAPR